MKRKKHYFRNFLILIFLGALVYLGFYVYNETDVFIIKDVSILGNVRISENELKAYLLSDDLHYFKLNEYELNEKLESYPKVKDGMITKVFPDRLEIVVNERMPVVAVAYSEQFLLVDEDMVVVEVSDDISNYYLIEGYNFENFMVGYEIKDAHRYVLENAINLAFLVMHYDLLENPKIVIEDKDINLLITDNLRAEFGNGENIEERFNSMIAVYETAMDNGLTSGVIKVFHDGYPALEPFEE